MNTTQESHGLFSQTLNSYEPIQTVKTQVQNPDLQTDNFILQQDAAATDASVHPDVQKIEIVSFYQFLPLTDEQVETVRSQLSELESKFSARGLCIMGREGVNATFSVPRNSRHAEAFKLALNDIILKKASAYDEPVTTPDGKVAARGDHDSPPKTENSLRFKISYSANHPFHDFKIKIRNEIVTLDRPDLVPKEKNHRHLSPEEWHKVMSEEDVVVVDTRNSYEYEIGRFKNAIDPKTRNFNEFPKWVQNELPKHLKKPDQKVLIYCTGGIRCEKAILEMEEQGYKNVYQLDGGILNYIEKFAPVTDEKMTTGTNEGIANSDKFSPDSSTFLNEDARAITHSPTQWDGECFVFDYRVAVDHNLRPSKKYLLCPHCGQPGKTKITCVQCKVEVIACDHCLEKGQKEELAQAKTFGKTLTEQEALARNQYHTCSKNCAHHFRMGHRTRRVHVEAFKKRRPT